MRYLVEFRLPSDRHREAHLKGREWLREGDEKDHVSDEEGASQEGDIGSWGLVEGRVNIHVHIHMYMCRGLYRGQRPGISPPTQIIYKFHQWLIENLEFSLNSNSGDQPRS